MTEIFGVFNNRIDKWLVDPINNPIDRGWKSDHFLPLNQVEIVKWWKGYQLLEYRVEEGNEHLWIVPLTETEHLIKKWAMGGVLSSIHTEVIFHFNKVIFFKQFLIFDELDKKNIWTIKKH